jgi:hypothetical protein
MGSLRKQVDISYFHEWFSEELLVSFQRLFSLSGTVGAYYNAVHNKVIVYAMTVVNRNIVF